jgi:outer membrane protein
MRQSFLKISIGILAIFGLAGNVFGETYTLDQCIDIALENNYGVIAAERSYNTSKTYVYSAWGSLLPTISISAGANRSWPIFTRFDESTGEVVTGRNRYSGSLNFSNTFAGLGLADYARIKKSRSDRASSYFSLEKTQDDLVLTVKGSYYDLIKAKMLLDVAKDAVNRGDERLRAVQSRYDLGSASMSDVLKAKVQYGNDRLDLVSKTNDYKLAQANLAFVMGVDVNREFDVNEEISEREINVIFEDAVNEALSNNPEYRKAQFDYASAESERTLAWSVFLPSLSMGLSHSTNVYKLSEFDDFRERNASYFMYASLSFNIFNGGSDYADLNSAKNKVRISGENLENTKNSVALEIKQSFLELERAREAQKLAEESVAAAQEDLNLVKEKYNLGAATILEVLDAEVSFKEAQTNHVQVLFDYNLAVSRLENALGR